MLDLKKWMTKVTNMFTDICYFDKGITTSYSAGTIGTRGSQVNFDNPMPSSYYIAGVYIRYIGDSSRYHPLAFYDSNANKFYVNFYRCDSSAVSNASVTIRIMYTKTAWGGVSS